VHPTGRFDGGGVTSFADPAWPDGPEHFRDGYRRFVDIYRHEGATNVTFFFHPDSVYGYMSGSYTERFEQYHWYYPADEPHCVLAVAARRRLRWPKQNEIRASRPSVSGQSSKRAGLSSS